MIQNTGYYYPTALQHQLGRRYDGLDSRGQPDSRAITTISTPEKASTAANSFGDGLHSKADYKNGGSPTNGTQRVIIQQLASGGTQGSPAGIGSQFFGIAASPQTTDEVFVTEQWQLVNPLIKSVDFGDLTYADDNLVEYSMEIAYDYAIWNGAVDAYGQPIKPLIGDPWMTFSGDLEQYNEQEAFASRMRDVATGAQAQKAGQLTAFGLGGQGIGALGLTAVGGARPIPSLSRKFDTKTLAENAYFAQPEGFDGQQPGWTGPCLNEDSQPNSGYESNCQD
jgi:hypothetical protein